MAEREPIGEVSKELDSEIENNEAIEKTRIAWGKLFSTFSAAALKQGVETTELEFEGSIDDRYFIKFHSPFSNDCYQPMIVNLDVYDQDNQHIQRASGLAIWEENIPEIISVNNHQMETQDTWFDLIELAKNATNIMLLTETVQTNKSTGLPINSIFPIPEIYIDSIH